MSGGIWKGSISFGLLNIPVTLQTAEETKEFHFSMLDQRDISPIKYKKVNAKTGKEVPFKNIVKGYQYKPGRYVLLNDKDFKSANVKATQTIDIEDFVLGKEIDLLLFDKPYYLVPQKSGVKGYFLLHKALEKTGKVAVAKIVIRIRQHLCAIMTRGDYLILEILRFAHEVKEVHEVNFLDDVDTRVKFSAKELKMAEALIDGMTSEWSPRRYRDTYYQDLEKKIKEKIKKGQSHELSDESEDSEDKIEGTRPARVIDLMPLLKQSLDARKNKRAPKQKSPRGRKHERA